MSIRNQSLATARSDVDNDDEPSSQPVRAGGERTAARRAVVQALYQWRVGGAGPVELSREFLEAGRLANVEREYFESLLYGVIEQAQSLAETFDRFLDRPASQLDPVEYVILLLATYELKNRPEIPFAAVIDQATQLTRVFGATDGHRFVNAVADRLAGHLRPKDPSVGR